MRMLKSLVFLLILSPLIHAQENKKGTPLPALIQKAFITKYPEAKMETWKLSDGIYKINIIDEEQNGTAEFSTSGIWKATKFPILEKELPGPIIRGIQTSFPKYRIKTAMMIQEPETVDYYNIQIKKESSGNPSAELHYSISGKLLRKIILADDQIVENVNMAEVEKDENEKAANTDSIKKADDNKVVEKAELKKTTSKAAVAKPPAKTTQSKSATKSSSTSTPKKTTKEIAAEKKAEKEKADAELAAQEQAELDRIEQEKAQAEKEEADKIAAAEKREAEKAESKKKKSKYDDIVVEDDSKMGNTAEPISSKELPSAILDYIYQKYPKYFIKESVLSVNDEATTYIVKLKKDGQKSLLELTFDINGKLINEINQ